MIREIFLPASFHQKRYFSEKNIGITIEEWGIKAIKVTATPQGIIIEKVLERTIDDKPIIGSKTGWNPKLLAPLLSDTIKKLGPFNNLNIALPSQLAIFREIDIPFQDREKIALVVGYEAEPLLPFPLEEAVLGFVATPIASSKSSKVFVAAWRTVDAQKFADMCETISITPTTITTDLFGLTSLATQNDSEPSLLVDITYNTTKLTLIDHKLPILTRVIPYGIDKLSSSPQGESPTMELQRFKMYGLKETGDKYYDDAVAKAFEEFFGEIEFTISSFASKSNIKPNKIIIHDRQFDVKGLVEACEKNIGIACKRISMENLVSSSNTKNQANIKTTSLNPFITSIGVAAPSETYESISMCGKVVRCAEYSLVRKQIKAAAFITTAILVALGAHAYTQLTRISNSIKKTETETTSLLKKLISERASRRSINIKRLLQAASEEVEDRTKAWNQFGCESITILESLLELTRLMDRNKYEAVITKFKIKHGDSGSTELSLEGTLTPKTSEIKQEMSALWRHITSSKMFSVVTPISTTYDDQTQTMQFSSTLAVRKL